MISYHIYIWGSVATMGCCGQVHPSKLLSHSMGLGQFPASEGAAVMYQEVIQRSCEAWECLGVERCLGAGNKTSDVMQKLGEPLWKSKRKTWGHFKD